MLLLGFRQKEHLIELVDKTMLHILHLECTGSALP